MYRVTITGTRYHMCYLIFPLRFAWFLAICNALPRINVISFFKKKLLIYIFFINLMINRGNALQIAPNYATLRENLQ